MSYSSYVPTGHWCPMAGSREVFYGSGLSRRLRGSVGDEGCDKFLPLLTRFLLAVRLVVTNTSAMLLDVVFDALAELVLSHRDLGLTFTTDALVFFSCLRGNAPQVVSDLNGDARLQT